MDGLMGRYHIRAKTRDSMTRLFYHFIDMAATNAYALYHRARAEKLQDFSDMSTQDEKILQLPEFREQIAAGLTTFTQKRLVGRPRSNSASQHSSRPSTPQNRPLPGALSVGKNAHHPVDDVRFDCTNHMPTWLEKKGGKKWCKFCKKSQTQCVCPKCDLHLCCSATKNCFLEYHTQKK